MKHTSKRPEPTVKTKRAAAQLAAAKEAVDEAANAQTLAIKDLDRADRIYQKADDALDACLSKTIRAFKKGALDSTAVGNIRMYGASTAEARLFAETTYATLTIARERLDKAEAALARAIARQNDPNL